MKKRVIDFYPDLEKIINKSEVCNIAMVDENQNPYVLPMNFAYDNKVIYLHSAPVGKKIDCIKHNNNVCISFSTDHELTHVNDEVACSYSMKYRSVLAYGKVQFIDDIEEKKKITNIVMKKYTGKEDFKYSKPAMTNVKIWKVEIDKIEGRAYGL